MANQLRYAGTLLTLAFLFNMNVIYVYLRSVANRHGLYHVVVSDRDREKGRVTIPAGLLQAADTGALRVRLFGENRYGRLHRQKTITVVE